MADFGLTEDMYCSNYYRRGKNESGSDEKVPIRWMAPESIEKDIYNEATDVVSLTVCPCCVITISSCMHAHNRGIKTYLPSHLCLSLSKSTPPPPPPPPPPTQYACILYIGLGLRSSPFSTCSPIQTNHLHINGAGLEPRQANIYIYIQV